MPRCFFCIDVEQYRLYAAGEQHPAPTIITANLTTAQGVKSLKLEYVDTPAAREQGLMNRTKLAPLDGMWFQFEGPSDVAFWMKNTLIPLDMLFVNAAHTIVYIAPSATPGSLAPIRSGQPVITVIELDGARAAKEGIAVGDRVVKTPASVQANQ